MEYKAILKSLDQMLTSPCKNRHLEVNFSPWSFEDYRQRLFSFKVGKWTSRPISCEAPAAARHGWSMEMSRNDALKCDCCGQVLFQPWPSDLCKEACNLDFEKTTAKFIFEYIVCVLAEKYRMEFIDGHSRSCAWRFQWCPNEISAYRQDNNEFMKEFQELAEKWNQIEINIKIELPVELQDSCLSVSRVLSLTGWIPKHNHPNVAECVLGCGTVLMSENERFDPVNCHRWFCPLMISLSGQEPCWLQRFQMQRRSGLCKTDSMESILSRHTFVELELLLKNS
jgi:hypothetical protein